MDNPSNHKEVKSLEGVDTRQKAGISSEKSVKKKHGKKLQNIHPKEKVDPNKEKKKAKNKSSQPDSDNFNEIDSPNLGRNQKTSFTPGNCHSQVDYSAKMNFVGNMRKQKNYKDELPLNGIGTDVVNVTDGFAQSSNFPNPKMTPVSKQKPKTPDRMSSGKKPSSAKRGLTFQPYIPLFEVQQGLKRGEFIEGALRINPRSYEDAYINSPDGKMDIYIGGMHERNRALNGDVVVVQVHPKQEWKILCDAIKDHQERSGENFVKAICNPVISPTPCQVHTPDKFLKMQESGTSWNGFSDDRKPDTLEILGVDKLVTDFNQFTVQCTENNQIRTPKEKSKDKKRTSKKLSSSQEESVASSSHDSLDSSHKSSPLQKNISYDSKSNLAQRDGTNAGNEMPLNASGYSQTKNCLSNNQFNTEMGKDFIQANVGENCSFDQKESCLDSTAINIVISPEQLLNFEDSPFQLEEENKVESNCIDDDFLNEGVIVVPPDCLSGDEFTDSASVTSSHSNCYEQISENHDFFTSQQDSQNNNTDLVDIQDEENQNMESVHLKEYLSEVVTLSNSLPKFTETKEYDCKKQTCRMPITSYEVSDESAISTALLTHVDSQINQSSSEENIILLPINECNVAPVINNEVIVEENLKTTKGKNSRPRKRRKKKSNACKKVTATVEPQSDVSAKMSEDILVEIGTLTIDDIMKHPLWPKFVQKTGKVVHILQRKHSSLAAGHIKLCQDRNTQWALFSPNDSRVPRIMVPMSDCPANFYKRPQDYRNVLFLAEIKDWVETSVFAMGRLIKTLGDSGDVSVETEAILLENGVDYSDFPEEVVSCLPESKNWTIPAMEISNRRDFRSNCVFTIDPSTARDMDDAVSCCALSNGNFEVGVHIADVTYFVKEGTALDSFAKNRATSVYLVQRVVPMLPRVLCDNLCSLNPGKDRLTFSVVWEISATGKIISEWFGRSVINSCMKMSYEHAQDMIENPNRIWTSDEHPEIYGGFSIEEIIKQVHQLHYLSVKLREKRFLDGALRLDQAKLQFTLNPETALPSGFNVFVQRDSNKLIEEFMLLANMSVAKKIYVSFPELALLRRHPPPQAKPMEDVVKMCAAMGIHLDASSSGALQASIACYVGNDFLSEARTLLLTNLCSKPMNCALYFCSGVLDDPTLFHHYALNVEFYTHFTSPIRRYPDIIVHRLLAAALTNSPIQDLKPNEVEICAAHCNDKKYNAKRVSELSSELFLAAFIRQCGFIEAKGIVTSVMDHSFDCLILEMGIIKRVYCDKLPLLGKQYERINGVPVLTLMWYDALKQKVIPQNLAMFSLVEITLTVVNETLKISATLKTPLEEQN